MVPSIVKTQKEILWCPMTVVYVHQDRSIVQENFPAVRKIVTLFRWESQCQTSVCVCAWSEVTSKCWFFAGSELLLRQSLWSQGNGRYCGVNDGGTKAQERQFLYQRQITNWPLFHALWKKQTKNSQKKLYFSDIKLFRLNSADALLTLIEKGKYCY